MIITESADSPGKVKEFISSRYIGQYITFDRDLVM